MHGVPVEVVGVTAKGAESREVFARTHGLKAFASFEELCDAVDAVDLCTAGVTHEPLAVAALERGKHVIVEKPFTGYYGPGTEDFRDNTFHRTRCNLNPMGAMETFNPREDILKDVYLTEKLGTKQGWSRPAPDEDWQDGYPQEFQDFITSFAACGSPLSNGILARDTIAVLYGAYLSAERRGAEVELTQ